MTTPTLNTPQLLPILEAWAKVPDSPIRLHSNDKGETFLIGHAISCEFVTENDDLTPAHDTALPALTVLAFECRYVPFLKWMAAQDGQVGQAMAKWIMERLVAAKTLEQVLEQVDKDLGSRVEISGLPMEMVPLDKVAEAVGDWEESTQAAMRLDHGAIEWNLANDYTIGSEA